jgi:hypothetical protein
MPSAVNGGELVTHGILVMLDISVKFMSSTGNGQVRRGSEVG